MSRQPLYWTLVRRWTSFDVMAVTSEKHDRVYGSNSHGGTHARSSDCHGRFADELTAILAKKEIVLAWEACRRAKEPGHKIILDAEARYEEEIKRICAAAATEAKP